jgi:hypothetical protein
VTNQRLAEATYFVGWDLGQSEDPAALAVVERAVFAGERDPATWQRRLTTRLALRHVERMPLGIAYTEMVQRIGKVVEDRELKGRCQLALDATGVGRPVVDMVRASGWDCGVLPVTITSGDAESSSGGYWRVPKRDLIVGLQVVIQRGELHIASGLKDGAALVKEMSEMRVKVRESGHEQFGVWGQGRHDDLVLSLSLAVWAARRAGPTCGERAEVLW